MPALSYRHHSNDRNLAVFSGRPMQSHTEYYAVWTMDQAAGVIAPRGTRGTSASSVLTGTADQRAVEKGTSVNFGVRQGFRQNFEACCANLRDANSGGSLDTSYAVLFMQNISSGGQALAKCTHPVGRGDVDGGAIDLINPPHRCALVFNVQEQHLDCPSVH